MKLKHFGFLAQTLALKIPLVLSLVAGPVIGPPAATASPLPTNNATTSPTIQTRIEQISARLQGQEYKAQLSEVRIPGHTEDRTVVVKRLTIVLPDGTTKMSDSTALETPIVIGGEHYRASLQPPLSNEERQLAISVATNQVDWVRKSAGSAVADRVAKFPTYPVATPQNVLNYRYSPNSQDNQESINRITSSMEQHSAAALEGIERSQNIQAQDTANFERQIEQGHQIAVQFSKEASRSDMNITSGLVQFADQMKSLKDSQTKLLAMQMAAADPYLQNVISDGQSKKNADIRSQTADVSPLNPKAQENIQKYPERYKQNGLLQNGAFGDGQIPFAPTPLGHRVLETANMLSDLILREPELMNGRPSSHLIGASYDYVAAAMRAQFLGQTDKAEKLLAEGRRLTRALRGESLPDDIEQAMTSRADAIAMHEAAIRAALGVTGDGKNLLNNAYGVAKAETPESQVALKAGQSLLKNSYGLTDSEVHDVALTFLDVALGFVPIVGGIKSALYLIAGYNLITNKPLSTADYILCAVDVLTLGGIGPISKMIKIAPEILGPAFRGSRALFASGMETATKLAAKYGGFIENSVAGLRQAEKYAPGLASRNIVTSPGALLALGQNIHKYGGDEFAKDLMQYSSKQGLSLVETAHISRFGGGYTRFVSAETYDSYIKGATMISGENGGRFFVVSTEEAEKSLAQMSKTEDLAKWIGVKTPQDGFVRIDIPFDVAHNPHLPSGLEAGANQYFESGGFTSGGAAEMTVQAVPKEQAIIRGAVDLKP